MHHISQITFGILNWLTIKDVSPNMFLLHRTHLSTTYMIAKPRASPFVRIKLGSN